MHLYLHKGRNIVVSRDAVPEEGTASVVWLALNPKLEGTAKRGRKPNYARGVPVKELEPLAHTDVSDTLLQDAEKHLASMDSVDTASETTTTDDMA